MTSSWSFRRWLLGLSAILCVVHATCICAMAEPKKRAATEGAPAKPESAPCRASLGDLDGFKSAMLRHDVARQAFRNKMTTGYYAVPGALNRDLLSRSPQELIATTAKAIERISDRATALLMYDFGQDRTSLCVWLVGSDGLLAAETVTVVPSLPVSSLARASLRVDVRAASRQPMRRGSVRPGAAKTTGDAQAPAMSALAEILLPPAIGQKLAQPRFGRILILPVGDLGTVPWPALPFENALLIDKASIVVLADIDWILQSMPEVQRARSPAFVVGDPDLKNDKEWRFTEIPAARLEASAVAGRWSASATGGSSTLLTGGDAARSSVLSALSSRRGFGLIYFATHGIADPVNPMDGSFLALKGGHLYGRDIKKLASLEDALVVMSACQTGLGKVFEFGSSGWRGLGGRPAHRKW